MWKFRLLRTLGFGTMVTGFVLGGMLGWRAVEWLSPLPLPTETVAQRDDRLHPIDPRIPPAGQLVLRAMRTEHAALEIQVNSDIARRRHAVLELSLFLALFLIVASGGGGLAIFVWAEVLEAGYVASQRQVSIPAHLPPRVPRSR